MKSVPSDVRPTKTEISLGIREFWSQSSSFTWRNFASLAIQNAPSEDSDQTALMRRMIWIYAEQTSQGAFSDDAVQIMNGDLDDKHQVAVWIYLKSYAFQNTGLLLWTNTSNRYFL